MTILVNFILAAIVANLAHELGHILAARCCRITVHNLGLRWNGFNNRRERGTGWREVITCLAGPYANLALALAIASRHAHPLLILGNFVYFAINILPITHSDCSNALDALSAMNTQEVHSNG